MTATQNWLPLTATEAEALASGFYTVDSENIRVRAEVHRTKDTNPDAVTAADGRFVERAVGGTSGASHSSGATLTRYYPAAAAAAGGVTVDNQSDPPAEVTTLIAPGATISGDEATLASGEQRVIRLGPLHVSWVDFGTFLEFTQPEIADIPAGAAIFLVRAIILAKFEDAVTGDLVFRLSVAPASDTTNLWQVVEYNLGNQGWNDGTWLAGQEDPTGRGDYFTVVNEDSKLIAGLPTVGGDPSAGEADVYVFYALAA
jgi:hypothetical protein